MWRIVSIQALLFVLVGGTAAQLGQRSQYNIPLPRLSVSLDENTKHFRHVKIVLDGNKEYAVITKLNDTYVKYTRQGRKKIVYAESDASAHMLTNFEASHINKVTASFVATLEILERDLQRQRWGRCLYLDSFLPRFLRGYYYLVCAGRNSAYALPPIGKIPDSEYDVSLNSPKSDERIGVWRSEKDYLIKLRIITKELIYQLRNWQKKELANPKRNPQLASAEKYREAFSLFIQIYFNIKPQPEVPGEGEHL